jgi:hypothetical protein
MPCTLEATDSDNLHFFNMNMLREEENMNENIRGGKQKKVLHALAEVVVT